MLISRIVLLYNLLGRLGRAASVQERPDVI